MAGTLRFGRYSVETSNKDKVFFPDEGITKGDLIEYYVAVAERALPHLKGRPLSLQRFPNGIEQSGFFQKDAPDHYPDWITTVPVKKKGGVNQHVVADKKAALAYLANNGAVTLHGALARAPDVDKPDRLVFDLDPSVDDLELTKTGARTVRAVLEELGLPTFIQTTGSRGFHVVVPIRQDKTFDELQPFVTAVAERVVDEDPDAFTVEHRKEKRGDRLLIDHFRNRYSQTAVVPYSVRARPGAPVAMPISWSELGKIPSAAHFTLGKAKQRVARGKDPWEGFFRRAVSLKKAMDKIG